MSRILLAAHGGETAKGAVRIARRIADRLGAQLDVVSVLAVELPLDYGYGVVYTSTPEQEMALAQELASEVGAQLAQCGVTGCTPVIRHGQAAVEIAAAARASNAMLIVVGLGPHRAVDRAFGGETALQLAQVASTPVLAVPGDASELPRNIVAAIDFTPSSLLAAQSAARLLATGDHLHLVHARTTADSGQYGAGEAAAIAAGRALDERLTTVASSLAVAAGVIVDHHVVSGSPARALLEEVERVHGDMIALGSHGYGLWKRLTIGSVASKILRLATTAVLVQPIASVTSGGGA